MKPMGEHVCLRYPINCAKTVCFSLVFAGARSRERSGQAGRGREKKNEKEIMKRAAFWVEPSHSMTDAEWPCLGR